MKQKSWTGTALWGALFFGLVAGGAAFAQDQFEQRGPGSDRPGFEQLDVNGDGTLTIAEMQAQAQARFDAIDTNGDGVISAEENQAVAVERVSARAAKQFARMLEWRDGDGDGALSAVEMSDNRAEKMFSHADSNDDGVVSAEEFQTAMSQGRRGGHAPHDGHQDGERHGHSGKQGGRRGG